MKEAERRVDMTTIDGCVYVIEKREENPKRIAVVDLDNKSITLSDDYRVTVKATTNIFKRNDVSESLLRDGS